jgi:hypothetical protein
LKCNDVSGGWFRLAARQTLRRAATLAAFGAAGDPVLIIREPSPLPALVGRASGRRRSRRRMRKLIAFDDDTFDKLKQLARDRMGTLQELADEAFADLLKKHGIPIDLKDALRKSAAFTKTPAKKAGSSPRRKNHS